jgi:hypothetical protein
VGITFLACLGYGAVFLLFGVLFRSPIIPTLLFLGWETINFLLPSFLKRISVIYHLNSLYPVPIPLSSSPFAILATPTPAWAAILGLVCLAVVAILICSLAVRRMEINYCAD